MEFPIEVGTRSTMGKALVELLFTAPTEVEQKKQDCQEKKGMLIGCVLRVALGVVLFI